MMFRNPLRRVDLALHYMFQNTLWRVDLALYHVSKHVMLWRVDLALYHVSKHVVEGKSRPPSLCGGDFCPYIFLPLFCGWVDLIPSHFSHQQFGLM